jgi:hypothetical protein
MRASQAGVLLRCSEGAVAIAEQDADEVLSTGVLDDGGQIALAVVVEITADEVRCSAAGLDAEGSTERTVAVPEEDAHTRYAAHSQFGAIRNCHIPLTVSVKVLNDDPLRARAGREARARLEGPVAIAQENDDSVAGRGDEIQMGVVIEVANGDGARGGHDRRVDRVPEGAVADARVKAQNVAPNDSPPLDEVLNSIAVHVGGNDRSARPGDEVRRSREGAVAVAAEETDRADIAVVVCRDHVENAVRVEVRRRHVYRSLPGCIDACLPERAIARAENDAHAIVGEVAVGGHDVLDAVSVEVSDGQSFRRLAAHVVLRERL